MNKKPHGIHTLLRLVWPHKTLFIFAMIALIGGSGINLLFPQVIRVLLNEDSIHYVTDKPLIVALGLIVLFAVQGVCFYVRTYLFGVIGMKAVKTLRTDLYGNIIQQGIDFFDKNRVGDLLSRISADTEMVREAVSIKLSVFIRYALQVLGGVILMMMISVKLTLALALILPVIISMSVLLGKRLRRLSKIQQEELARASTVAEETISGARIVHAFNQIDTESSRFDTTAERVLDAGLKRTAVAAFFASFVSFLMNAAIVVVLIYGSTLITNGTLSIGDLTAFFLYGVIVAVSFAFIANGMSEFASALGATEKLFELIHLPKQPGLLALTTPSQLQEKRAEVEFQQVSFAYPTRPEAMVLQDISFHIAPGTSLALVGPSGAGKSSIVNLLLAFYQPTSGTILFSGQDTTTLTPYEIREQIGIVPQDPQLFAVSIRDNLRYGKRQATEEELFEACAKANILDFIESLPDGLDTFVGERGVQLSGGQKQRLAIARSILRDPKLLVLDEATSSLDSENEHLIQQALDHLMKDRSSLIIAHRLSTIRNVDQVIVLDQGKVVQSGTHHELSEIPGLYKSLVDRQELSDG